MSHTEKVEFEVPAVGSVWETGDGTAKVLEVQARVSYQFTDDEGDGWDTSRALDNFLDVYEPAEDKIEAGQTWVYSSSGLEFYVYEVSDVQVFGRATYNDGDPYADDYNLTTFRTYWKLKK